MSSPIFSMLQFPFFIYETTFNGTILAHILESAKTTKSHPTRKGAVS
jgi:hypothetical protein